MRPARGTIKAALLALSLLLVSVVGGQLPVAAVAQSQTDPPWEQLRIPGPVYRLFTPGGGVLYALTESGLYRSDDAGSTWLMVPVPHKTQTGNQGVFATPWAPVTWQAGVDWQAFERYRVAIDPHNAQVIYADIVEGLGKSIDGGRTWTIVLPFTMRAGVRAPILQVAVSAADSQLVYASNGKKRLSEDKYELHRSRDGGSSWETINTYDNAGGYWLHPLYPHPTDPNSLTAVHQDRKGVALPTPPFTNCKSPGGLGYIVAMTHDRWSGRLYLVESRGIGVSSPSRVCASDAGGPWSEAFSVASVADVVLDPDGTDVLAVAPAADGESLYVGLQRRPQYTGRSPYDPDPNVDTEIFLSQSQNGAKNLSRAGMGWMYDLALSIGGSYLYAATEAGLWRLPDPASQPGR